MSTNNKIAPILPHAHSVNVLTEKNLYFFYKFYKYRLCVTSSRKYVVDDIGKHFLDHAIELVKPGMKFVYVIDNIDWEEGVHDTREHHQNKSVHAVATSMVFSRISSDQLPDDGPQKDVKTCNFREIVSVGDEEMKRVVLYWHLGAF